MCIRDRVNVGDVTVQRGRSGIAGFRLWHAGAAMAALLLAACTASSPPPLAPQAAVVAPVKPAAETELPAAVQREHQRILAAYGGVYNDPRLQAMICLLYTSRCV